MHQWQVDEFRQELAFPPLPCFADSNEHDFVHRADTGFIDGLKVDGEPSRWGTLSVERFANNEVGFPRPELDYVIRLNLGPSVPALEMEPQTAVALGHLLLLAGTASLRDLAENSAFLTELGVDR
ncbi:hypothetical protein EF294_07385 [Gordonia oryzae]|uniref:Uncharacterized protein n=1 Tax=Gordonia oryzae TaxID=2487349 RepID=A0A3N4GTX2_9ACTN|nr:hypothetical protein [Gordonia oryzae]RPA64897.1 hypothetical protein EF294_07385 [Gordonia oryzae]